MESPLTALEMSPPAAAEAAADQGAIEELRRALAQANATVDELRRALAQSNATVEQTAAALEQLTLQYQASLGFDAKRTFDCPSCRSRGTVATPVSCTSCGHEAEWGSGPGE